VLAIDTRKFVKRRLHQTRRVKEVMGTIDGKEVHAWPTPHLARPLLQLAGFSGNRPQAVFGFCYRHIIVTLLRDLKSRPHNILIEFTYEFTKQFLSRKEMYAAVLFPSS
jgi:hypothetical protein